MPRVVYVTPSGEKVAVDNAEGNLMRVAVDNDVEGILGDCGGVCSCATCHVQVAPEWAEKVGPATEEELDVLEFQDEYAPNSRLSCQIELTPELDGVVVHVVGQ